MAILTKSTKQNSVMMGPLNWQDFRAASRIKQSREIACRDVATRPRLWKVEHRFSRPELCGIVSNGGENANLAAEDGQVVACSAVVEAASDAEAVPAGSGDFNRRLDEDLCDTSNGQKSQFLEHLRIHTSG